MLFESSFSSCIVVTIYAERILFALDFDKITIVRHRSTISSSKLDRVPKGFCPHRGTQAETWLFKLSVTSSGVKDSSISVFVFKRRGCSSHELAIVDKVLAQIQGWEWGRPSRVKWVLIFWFRNWLETPIGGLECSWFYLHSWTQSECLFHFYVILHGWLIHKLVLVLLGLALTALLILRFHI